MSRATAAATARLAVWSVFLALALRLLHGSTLGALSIPMGSIHELGAWADRTSPAVMALGLVRLAALVAAWYLVVVSVLVLVADVAGWRGLARAVGAVSPAVVTRLATRGAGAGLAAGALLGGLPLPSPLDATPSVEAPAGLASPLAPAPAFGATGPSPSPAVAARPPSPARPSPARTPAAPAEPAAAGPSSATATMTRLPASPEATATMTRLPDAARPADPDVPEPTRRAGSPATPPAPAGQAGAATAEPGGPAGPPGADLPLVPPPGPADPPASPRPRPPAANRAPAGATPTHAPAHPPAPSPHTAPAHQATSSAGAPPEEWVVEPGDSFWTIAEEAVADARPGAAPSDDDVAAYWRRLIDANRDRLAAPTNPDLLLAGQRLVLPAVP